MQSLQTLHTTNDYRGNWKFIQETTMYSQQNVQKTQPEGDFADAWRSHREESRSLHELLLYPVMIHALAAVKGLSCLLDAGCGTGVLTHAAIEILQPQTTLATDLEESLVKEALARCGDTLVAFAHDLARGIPVPSASVDGILCSNVLMHLKVKAAYQFVQDVGRVLTEEGRAVVAVTHPEWVQRHYASGGVTFPFTTTRLWGATPVEQTYLDASGYRTLFAGGGLDIIERIELAVPNVAGLSPRYAASVGTPIYDVYCLQRTK